MCVRAPGVCCWCAYVSNNAIPYSSILVQMFNVLFQPATKPIATHDVRESYDMM